MSTVGPTPADRLVVADLPGESEGGSYVYALEFGSGVVKVGITRNPAMRLKTHEQTARVFGTRIVRHWISTPHGCAAENERMLIAFCAEMVPRVDGGASGEYFDGPIFDDVVTFAQALSYAPRSKADEPPRRTDYSREESLRRLGPELMEDIARQVAAAPPPTATQIKALRALFDQIDIEAAREVASPSAA